MDAEYLALAITNATGKIVYELPITPERVVRSIHAKGNGH